LEHAEARGVFSSDIMAVDVIKEIPISYIAQPDFWAVFWAWHHDKSGGFLVRSAYRMTMESKQRREHFLEDPTKSSNSDLDEKNWQKL
jgi:hypothetical protein